MIFGPKVTTMTQVGLLPKVVNTVLNGNVLTLRLIGNAKPWKGTTLEKAIKYQNSNSASSFSGLDTFSAAELDTKVRMSYEIKAIRQPVAIAGLNALVNSIAETKVTDMVIESLEETQQELLDAIGSMIYGLGTGNNNKDFNGIGAIVDDGTDTTTIGGLTRSSYPVVNAIRTSSGGTLTLNKMATLFSAVSHNTPSTTPNIGVANETVWDLYESLLTPMIRENYALTGSPVVGARGGMQRQDGFKGEVGFTALSYKGIPIVRDEKCTAQTLILLNEQSMDWYGADASKAGMGYKSISLGSSTMENSVYNEAPLSQFSGFNWSGWLNPTNQFGVVAEVNLIGNLVSFAPSLNGKLVAITGV